MKKIIAISLLMAMMCFALFACQLRTIDSKDSEENTSAEDTDTNGIFKLNISFIGWYVLCFVTFGIGTFFLMPYINAATAEFYVELKSMND